MEYLIKKLKNNIDSIKFLYIILTIPTTKKGDKMEDKNVLRAIFEASKSINSIKKLGRTHGYTYVTFQDLKLELIAPFQENDLYLSFITGFELNGNFREDYVITRIYHVPTGEYIQNKTPVNSDQPTNKNGVALMNRSQAYGAGLTYAKRYGLMSLLGLPATEDFDGEVSANRLKAQVQARMLEQKAKEDIQKTQDEINEISNRNAEMAKNIQKMKHYRARLNELANKYAITMSEEDKAAYLKGYNLMKEIGGVDEQIEQQAKEVLQNG